MKGWVILYVAGSIGYFSNVQWKSVSKCISHILNSEPGWGFLNIITHHFLLFLSLLMSFFSISDHLAFLLLSVLHWPFNIILCRELPASVKVLSFLLMSGSLPKGRYLFLAQLISSHLNQHPLQHVTSPPSVSLLSHHFVCLCHSGLITHLSRLFSIYLGQHVWGNSCHHLMLAPSTLQSPPNTCTHGLTAARLWTEVFKLHSKFHCLILLVSHGPSDIPSTHTYKPIHTGRPS